MKSNDKLTTEEVLVAQLASQEVFKKILTNKIDPYNCNELEEASYQAVNWARVAVEEVLKYV